MIKLKSLPYSVANALYIAMEQSKTAVSLYISILLFHCLGCHSSLVTEEIYRSFAPSQQINPLTLQARGYSLSADWPSDTSRYLMEVDSSFSRFSQDIVKALARIAEVYNSGNKTKQYEGEGVQITRSVSLEYLKPLRAWVIYLPFDQFFLGQGRHKQVSKVIFVKNDKAYIAAHCWGDSSTKSEVDVLNAVKDEKGVVPFLGAVPRKNGTFFSIYLLYCNGGELRSFVRKKSPEHFSFRQMMIIAQGVVAGLKSLHKHGFIHFDIHTGNVFLIKCNDGLKGVLGDFGHTFNIDHPGKRPAYVAARRVPPEALTTMPDKLDRFKTDIHALGATFYEMAWYDFHPWGFLLPRSTVHLMSSDKRKWYYTKLVAAYKSYKEKSIGDLLKKQKNGVKLSPKERFKVLVFQMMHYLPEKRPSLQKIHETLQQILSELDE